MNKVPHVILAEDEDLVAMSLSIALEDAGCRVTVTHNGLEALQMDEADPADVLVTDMRMPEMDGATLIRMIRRRRSTLPIVVMTGYSDGLPREEANRLVLLRKPFAPDTLAWNVQSLLAGTGTP
ncbi:response regulator [Azospirillum agricola]|uniref:response regulator n=1 Tax=Azospirillum agricola TaxID=1720247 RepID=UPI000A0F21D1|nr:response regulator [Azospirillum agricola]SMH39430.1 Response regulator receiver domain-containing protein [Azospirillum lipoferum]